MKKASTIAFTIILLAGLSWYGFGLASSHTSVSAANPFPVAPAAQSEPAAASAAALQPRTPPAGQKEYANAHYDFSLFYPQDLSVQTYNEGGGASTITFQDTATVQGFQVFVVPYTQGQVSEARFNMDEPSGVRQDLKDITIDGAVGASFYGQSTTLGDTAEVWFVHGGFLYEVTTLKPLASWLSNIMATWQFSAPGRG